MKNSRLDSGSCFNPRGITLMFFAVESRGSIAWKNPQIDTAID